MFGLLIITRARSLALVSILMAIRSIVTFRIYKYFRISIFVNTINFFIIIVGFLYTYLSFTEYAQGRVHPFEDTSTHLTRSSLGISFLVYSSSDLTIEIKSISFKTSSALIACSRLGNGLPLNGKVKTLPIDQL